MRRIERHYGMDWLRIAAFALLILYHIGMYFVPWGWHVKSPEISQWAQLPMLATNGWRLLLLFLVSGYASAALFAKTGAVWPFLASRFVRLVVPVVFAAALLILPQPWVELVTQHGYSGGFLSFWLHDYFRFGTLEGIVLPTWQHLWFVVYLWHYTLAAALVLVLPGTVRAAIGQAASRALAGPLVVLVPVALLALHAFVLFPDLEITHALFDDPGAHLLYLPGFAFGWLLAGNDALWSAIRRWWKSAAALALAGTGAILLLVGLVVAGAAAWDERVDTLFEAIRAVQAWSVIVALIGAADRWCNRDHPWRKPLNEAVYPAYIIHQTIIVVVGFWLLGTGVGAWSAFAILLAATALGCWLFYRVGREVPGLRLLIGLTGWRAKPHDKRAALRHEPASDVSA